MNYHLEMLKTLEKLKNEGQRKRLLLHTCCAPCSTTALMWLSDCFDVTVLYYNPNISPREEYEKRKEEQKRLLNTFLADKHISFLDCDYDNASFLEIAKGLENEKERGKRCYLCYKLRLGKTAILAKENGFDFFASSLSVSPYKVSRWLNEIGFSLSEKYGVSYLCSDFKKEHGYLKSIEFSKKYNLYRQNYCGCEYSKR